MNNNLNSLNSPRDCFIENISIKNFFKTLKEAQTEILIRERFENI